VVKAKSSLALKVKVGDGRQVGHVGLLLGCQGRLKVARFGQFADRMRVGEVLSEALGVSGVTHDR